MGGCNAWEGHARWREQLEHEQGGGGTASWGTRRKSVWLEQEGLFKGIDGGIRADSIRL